MQHLHLHIGRQRQALALDFQPRGQAGLVLELLQCLLQRGFDVIVAVGARAEVRQQFARTSLMLSRRPSSSSSSVRCTLSRLRALQRSAQQLHLDLQEHQRLRDGVMRFAPKRALLAHGGLALSASARRPSSALARWLANASSSSGFFRAELYLAAEEQIHLAQHALLQAHRHAHQVLVARAHAVHGLVPWW